MCPEWIAGRTCQIWYRNRAKRELHRPDADEECPYAHAPMELDI